MSRIVVIGSGFSGLSAACYLSAAGHDVLVLEKNSGAGGRARQFSEQGYTFDMGPSWYWMPDVFENFFRDFNHKTSDYYQLDLLNPSFEIIFAPGEKMSIPAGFEELCELFESIESGAAEKLKKFMKEAQVKYQVGMQDMVYLPNLSIWEYVDPKIIRQSLKINLFSSFSKHVRRFFKDRRLISLMEFPVLFLGAMPADTPALYSLMNYAGLKLGTWYPQGGFGKVIEGMVSLAEENGAELLFNSEVSSINVTERNKVTSVTVNGEDIACDAVIATGDYNHVETKLLPPQLKNYSENYWEEKTFAPSSLIFYLGISKKLDGLEHHSLFFEEELDQHAIEIYKKPQWPSKPLFYVCCPSKTDSSVAPEGHENLFILMPLAPGIEDNETLREKYFEILISRLEKHLQQDVRSFIDYKRSYCINDFVQDYHSYKGNAYGLANTLKQTAIFKPSIRNKKIGNLLYAGQLTVPGPGVPPSLISGKIAAELLIRQLKKSGNEITV